MTTLLLTLAGVVVLLLATGYWTIRQRYTAAAVAGIGARAGAPGSRPASEVHRMPACDLGGQLMAAVSTQPPASGASGSAGPGSGGEATGGGGGGAPSRAPKRKTGGGPTRRSFLRTAWLAVTGVSLASFGGASLGFLWPNLAGGFGSELDVESEQTILDYIRSERAPFAYPAGRMWITTYDPALDPDGVYADVTDGGQATLMAIYQRCVHLGCRVPFNVGPQRFQCPCHGSNYTFWGEYILGPAPRGLDRFPLRIDNGRVLVNTAQVVTGPSRGTVLYQES